MDAGMTCTGLLLLLLTMLVLTLLTTVDASQRGIYTFRDIRVLLHNLPAVAGCVAQW